MLIDILSTSNYVSYNINLAQIFGLHTAIYINEVLNIQSKAIKKNKFDDDRFVLDREYLTSRTTFSVKEQLDIEDVLVEAKILTKTEKNSNEININTRMITQMLMSEDDDLESVLKNIAEVKAKPTKKTKQAKIVDNLKMNIYAKNNELITAYEEWIDAVYSKQGWMSKQAVIEGQKIVDKYANHNLDTALSIIHIAAINGYRDMTWAVNKLPKQRDVKTTVNQKVELSNDSF